MRRKSFIILLALCIAVMPFLGFPSSWEDAFYACAGVLILLLAVDWSFLQKRKTRNGRSKRNGSTSDVYVESAPKASSGFNDSN